MSFFFILLLMIFSFLNQLTLSRWFINRSPLNMHKPFETITPIFKWIFSFWFLSFRVFLLIHFNIVIFNYTYVINFFFFKESFNLWHPLLIIALYYQTKDTNQFWCTLRLNPRSLIQLSKILPVELIRTHHLCN